MLAFQQKDPACHFFIFPDRIYDSNMKMWTEKKSQKQTATPTLPAMPARLVHSKRQTVFRLFIAVVWPGMINLIRQHLRVAMKKQIYCGSSTIYFFKEVIKNKSHLQHQRPANKSKPSHPIKCERRNKLGAGEAPARVGTFVQKSVYDNSSIKRVNDECKKKSFYNLPGCASHSLIISIIRLNKDETPDHVLRFIMKNRGQKPKFDHDFFPEFTVRTDPV